jgi:hypothetical protein
MSGIDILTLRPRATELYQLGFLEVLESESHEGIYRAVSATEAREKFFAKRKAAMEAQQPELL